MTTPQAPVWNKFDLNGSIKAYAEYLHQESARVFLQDKTHVQVMFLFKEEGIVSVNAVPPQVEHLQVYEAIRGSIEQYDLYGVILIGECWMYLPKNPKDHTVAQIKDGEIKVSELNNDDRKEVLHLKMEARDGVSTVYLNRILRDGGNVELGKDEIMDGVARKWFGV